MSIYNKIKKEYLFIFIVIWISLVLFAYFDFGYNSFAIKDRLTCDEQGYSCCEGGTGKGDYYFSLDNTCVNNRECWSFCEIKKEDLITGNNIFTDAFEDIKGFFNNLFKLEPVAGKKTLDVNRDGDGDGTVYSSNYPNDINCGNKCSASFSERTVYLTATPDSNSMFLKWSGCLGITSIGDCYVYTDKNYIVTATFNKAPKLNSLLVNVPQNMCPLSGGGNDGLKCEESVAVNYCKALGHYGYVQNSKVCDDGGHFRGNWANHELYPLTRDCGSGGSDRWITQLNCETLNPILKVEKDGNGLGDIISTDNRINCGDVCETDVNLETKITFIATPDSNSMFLKWSGCGLVISDGKCSFEGSSNDGKGGTVTATFNKNVQDTTPPTISVSSVSSGEEYTTESPYIIVNSIPEDLSYMPIIRVKTDETADCKFSLEDKGYSEIMGSNCDFSGGNHICILGLNDLGNLISGGLGEKIISISCKDEFDNEHTSMDNEDVIFSLQCATDSLKSGTQCLVCNSNKNGYIQDNLKCNNLLLPVCNSAGICIALSPDCGNGNVDSGEECDQTATWPNGQCNSCQVTCDQGYNENQINHECTLQTFCNPGSIQTGTTCLVCNSQGNAYSQDDTKCDSGETCNSQGQCIIITQTCSLNQCVNSNTICNNGVPQICPSGKICSSNQCVSQMTFCTANTCNSNDNTQICKSDGSAYVLCSSIDTNKPICSSNQCVSQPTSTVSTPVNLTVSIDSQKIILSWKMPTTNPIGSVVRNILTTEAVNENVFTDVISFVKRLFKKEVRGTNLGNDVDGYKIYRQDLVNNTQPVFIDTIILNNLPSIVNNCDKTQCTYNDILSNPNYQEKRYRYSISAYKGNLESDKTVIDITKPSLTILKINNLATSTSSRDVTLNLEGNYIYECKFASSVNSLQNVSTFTQYQNNIPFTLEGDYGNKQIAAQCRNVLGVSPQISNTITYEKVRESNCNNNQDDDNDGISDDLDADCNSGKYIKLDKVLISSEEPYENSDVNIQCKILTYNLNTLDNNLLSKAEKCIKARSGENSCSKIKREGQFVSFRCDAGNLGVKEFGCTVSQDCNVFIENNSPVRNLTETIEVTKPELCEDVTENDNLDISEPSLNKQSYKFGDKIIPELVIINAGDKINIQVDALLYDLNKRKLIKEETQTKVIDDNLDKKTFNPEIIIPNLPESKYKLYFKISEFNGESDFCIEKSKLLSIKGTSIAIDDQDNDKYTTDDCDDNDPLINQNATEICTDGKDNDCNDLTDSLDTVCQAINTGTCKIGDIKSCGLNIGECRQGTQTCASGTWGFCTGAINPIAEICDDNKDNDCDSLTDSSDPNCISQAEENQDSDNDGLLDNWEVQFFGNLEQGSDDDFDGDGVKNIAEYSENTDPSNSNDKPEKSSATSTFLIVFVLLIIVGGLIYFFALKPKKPKLAYELSQQSKPYQVQSKTNMVLRRYIINALNKGFSKEQIKKALSNKGWKEKDIEEAFKAK